MAVTTGRRRLVFPLDGGISVLVCLRRHASWWRLTDALNDLARSLKGCLCLALFFAFFLPWDSSAQQSLDSDIAPITDYEAIQGRDNFYTVRGSFMTVEEDFQNDFGFIRRGAIRKTNAFAGIRPRPEGGRGLIREIFPQVDTNYVTDQQDRLLTRTHRAGISIQFRDGDRFTVNRNMRFERLDEEFRIRSGVNIPAGDYAFNDWDVSFRGSGGRKLTGDASLTHGDFWTGTRRQTRLGVRYRQSIHFTTQVDWSRNKIELDQGSFTTDLVGLRLNFAFSPRVFFENFIQYNTDSNTVSSNIRFRFLHHPLSDFFIVYNERRGVSGSNALERALIIKLTNLFSF